jgi:hypothetical protein
MNFYTGTKPYPREHVQEAVHYLAEKYPACFFEDPGVRRPLKATQLWLPLQWPPSCRCRNSVVTLGRQNLDRSTQQGHLTRNPSTREAPCEQQPAVGEAANAIGFDQRHPARHRGRDITGGAREDIAQAAYR